MKTWPARFTASRLPPADWTATGKRRTSADGAGYRQVKCRSLSPNLTSQSSSRDSRKARPEVEAVAFEDIAALLRDLPDQKDVISDVRRLVRQAVAACKPTIALQE